MRRRSIWFFILLISLALLVIALVVIRTDSDENADESLPMRLAIGLVFCVLTLGPAWVADGFLRQIPGAMRRRRELKRRRKEHAAPVKRKRKAARAIYKIEHHHDAHEYWSACARGRYNEIWKNARGSSVDLPPSGDTP